MELEIVNKLFLELSQFATAQTGREVELQNRLNAIEQAQAWETKRSGKFLHQAVAADRKIECLRKALFPIEAEIREKGGPLAATVDAAGALDASWNRDAHVDAQLTLTQGEAEAIIQVLKATTPDRTE